MLQSLRIENIAIIDSVSVDFINGLNVLTGETGAGKSIIIDAINAVTGEKTSRDLIRTGEKSAFVSAEFTEVPHSVIAVLEDYALPVPDDGVLILSRRLERDGRNVCRVNGAAVTVAMLHDIGSHLINIHGQHDSGELLNSETHCSFIDSFSGTERLLEDYRKNYRELTEIKRRMDELTVSEDEKVRKTDILTYEINEIKSANIKTGEREALLKRRDIIRNSKKLTDALRKAYVALDGDNETDGASSLTAAAAGSLLSVDAICSGALAPLAETLNDSASLLTDAAAEIGSLLEEIGASQDNIDVIEERLDVIYRLSKKYGSSEEEILAYLENAQSELESIESADEEIEKLRAKHTLTLNTAREKAIILSRERMKGGERLSDAVIGELHYLDMPSVVFTAGFTDIPLSENGADGVEFLISANVGEEPRPLAKVASGGELSRIMLALRNVLSAGSDIGTMIFDEIDTGVSGRAAGKIGLKLASVSRGKQVLCITHSAQIAAFADAHLLIKKDVSGERTFTQVTALDENGRVNELARFIGGMEITSADLAAAKELLSRCGSLKKEG